MNQEEAVIAISEVAGNVPFVQAELQDIAELQNSPQITYDRRY